jgi:hypothetical protein
LRVRIWRFGHIQNSSLAKAKFGFGCAIKSAASEIQPLFGAIAAYLYKAFARAQDWKSGIGSWKA